jgi:hypothetical protein
MQFKSFFTVLAAGLSMVAAQSAEGDITTTQTSTLTQTQTVTITQCNPTVSNCPGFTVSSASTSTETTTSTVTSWSFPLSNSSSTVGPTAVYSSKPTFLTSRPVITQTSFVDVPGTSSTGSAAAPSSSGPVTAGAGGLFVQPALFLGVLGAGVALLA